MGEGGRRGGTKNERMTKTGERKSGSQRVERWMEGKEDG